MTEYQYYEFQALERPLTQAQMAELRNNSSSARITPDSFVNVYSRDSFKGDPDKWMEEYFDALLYLADWGSRLFMVRVPKSLLDPDTVSLYCADESLYSWSAGDHLIMSFNSEEGEDEWPEGEDWLTSLLSIRSDLMRGDHRALYLGWLLAVQSDEMEDDAPEPPVPSGLGHLNAALGCLADFLRIDSDLISAAAERCPADHPGSLSRKRVESWVRILAKKEKDELLVRLINGGDAHLAAELRQRAAREMLRRGKLINAPRRTAGEIAARAERIASVRSSKAAEQRAILQAQRKRVRTEKRKKHLKSLAGTEAGLWAKVEMLVAARQSEQYDDALTILHDLRDLADMKGARSEFSVRMGAFCLVHTRKTRLIARLREAELMIENLSEEMRIL